MILVTGATGQIGSELVPALRERYGAEEVVAAGHERQPSEELLQGPFVYLDVTRRETIEAVVEEHEIDTIYHLAALLSVRAEEDPQQAWRVNVDGLLNVLEVARTHGVQRVFFPSSIAAFGPSTPLDDTPQETIQRPNAIYGITKVTGELLCDYYFHRYGLDTRGLRLPGLISHKTPPGGGTTDYAVEIFYAALQEGHYTCPLRADTRLEMMYMPDAIRAIILLMEADGRRLRHRNAYNVTAVAFTPAELVAEIKKHLPDFSCDYRPDPVRQAIADSWPNTMDDSAARADWGWQPEYDLERIVAEMLTALRAKLNLQSRE